MPTFDVRGCNSWLGLTRILVTRDLHRNGRVPCGIAQKGNTQNVSSSGNIPRLNSSVAINNKTQETRTRAWFVSTTASCSVSEKRVPKTFPGGARKKGSA
jgi:hypothetical protein